MEALAGSFRRPLEQEIGVLNSSSIRSSSIMPSSSFVAREIGQSESEGALQDGDPPTARVRIDDALESPRQHESLNQGMASRPAAPSDSQEQHWPPLQGSVLRLERYRQVCFQYCVAPTGNLKTSKH